MLWNKKTKLNTAIWLTVVALAVLSLPAAATAQDVNDFNVPDFNLPEDPNLEAELRMPGTIEGTGTYFEVTDSNYIDITFESTEPVHLMLESIPEMVMMEIEAAEGAASTQITLAGFVPSTTYYKYQDDYHNLTEFTTNESGSYTYTQDLAEPHIVFIQPQPGTKFIPTDTSIGIWDAVNRIYTLTTDVYETIQIDEDNLTLDGAGYTVTGVGSGYGVYLNGRTGVTIKNLTIKRFSRGIDLHYSSDNELTGNSVSNSPSGAGINLYQSSNNTLTGNTANSNFLGILIRGSNNELTNNNSLNNNSHGIYLFGNSNTLTGNSVSNNGSGILLTVSSTNTLRNNTMSGNHYNFRVHGFEYSHFDHDIDTSNLVNGKPIYYVKDITGPMVYDSSTNAGVFYAINCNNITIKDLTLTGNWDGIYLYGTENSRIEDVTASNNLYCGLYLHDSTNNTLTGNIANSNIYGIYLYQSSSNTLTNNNISNNNGVGIHLNSSSNNTLIGNIANSNYYEGIYLERSIDNTLTGNTISDNSQRGIYLRINCSNNTLTCNTANSNRNSGIYLVATCQNNTLTGNTASNNSRYGIYLGGSSDNTLTYNTIAFNNIYGMAVWGSTYNSSNNNQIYNNNFIDNTTQASVYLGSGNVFNLDVPTGGNYWSDWTGPDADGDGFVDSPYVFSGGQDNLPLVSPVPSICNEAPLAVCQDVTVMADSNCEGVVAPEDVDNGSSDPDGDPITLSLSPEGPYPIGTTAVTLTVTDDQGASSACTATVKVLTASEGILQLIAKVMVLNLHNGIENSLDAKLENALKALDDLNINNDVSAINAIEAFINHVQAQSGDKISVADADDLIYAANNITVALQNGCY